MPGAVAHESQVVTRARVGGTAGLALGAGVPSSSWPCVVLKQPPRQRARGCGPGVWPPVDRAGLDLSISPLPEL